MTTIVLSMLFIAIGIFAVASVMRSLTGGFAAAKMIFEELYGHKTILPATRRAPAYAVTRVPAHRRPAQRKPQPAACA